jgi:hypothetical protein
MPAKESYQVENILSGWQRFSGLAADRSQALHMYAGSLLKAFNFLDLESGENSQTFLVDLFEELFSLYMRHLTSSHSET